MVKPLGTPIEVVFKLPDMATPIRVTGTVRWVRLFSKDSDTSPGMGVRFDHIPVDQEARIREFLDRRPPLFHDVD